MITFNRQTWQQRKDKQEIRSLIEDLDLEGIRRDQVDAREI